MMERLFLARALTTALVVVGCEREEQQPVPAAAATPPAPPGELKDTPEGRARTLLEQLSQQVGQGRWADAERILKQLDAMKASLKPELREEIENAQSTSKAAKLIQEGK